MDVTGLKKQREMIVKKKEDIEYERKKYLEEYSELKEKVTKVGLVSLICLILQIMFAIFLNGKSATLIGIAKLMSPFVLAIFIVSLIIFLSKGFDLFINADSEWSKKLAIKLERTRFVEVLEGINSNIIRLDIEIDKLNNELELAGVDVDNLDNVIKVENNEIKENKQIKSKATEIKNTDSEMIKKEAVYDNENEKSEVKKTVVKKAVFEQKTTDNVDDLLNALDNLGIPDDEDEEFENSSELWKKDSKILR